MPESERYSIIFNGNLHAGTRRHEALQQISLMTNVDVDELLDALFSVKPVIINQVEDRVLAETYLDAFQKAGLELYIELYCAEHDDITNAEILFSHYAPIARQDVEPNYLLDDPTQKEQPIKTTADVVSESSHYIIFNGRLNPGVTKNEAIENICNLTKSEPEEVIEQVFSVVPVILIETTDINLAQAYQRDFTHCGLQVVFSETLENKETLAVSQLRVREDIPPPAPKRKVPGFVLLLLCLTLLGTVFWSTIYLFNKGYFEQDSVQTLDIKLEYAKVTPVKITAPSQPEQLVKDVIPKPIKEIIPPNIRKKPIAPQRKEQSELPEKPALSEPIPTAKPSANQQKLPNKDVTTDLSPSQLAQLEQDYFLQLLNWFARPEHQSYDKETRGQNLEGEIKVKISIYRNGKIKDVTILSSSSEQLTQVTQQSAFKASPYPPVPKEITGENYSFTLPLKYTLEGK